MVPFLRPFASLIAAVCVGQAHADLDSDLADLSARAAYGYYVRDAAVIAAALEGLEQLQAKDGRVSVERALSAMRLAHLSAPGTKRANEMLIVCVAAAEEAAQQLPSSAEPWILSSACSARAARAETVKAVLHNRRTHNALARARSIDAANPRLALVEAWRVADDAADLDSESAAALIPKLEAAVAVFREGRHSEPDWGEAETLALLGALYLRKGDVRAARDVIEHALLAAPGYEDALELKRRLELHVVGAREPGG